MAEAPGEIEVDTGIPLTGPSGRLFDSLLRTAGIDRRDCLVTNVFDEKAPDNNVKPWMNDAGRVAASFARLEEELSAVSANVIVPMGATALWALSGETALGKIRGNVLPATRIVPGAKLLPTFHPAFVLRMWKWYTIVAADLMRASIEAERGPSIHVPVRRLLVDPTIEEVEAAGEKCLAASLVSPDIETAWQQITHVGFAWSAEEAISIPFVDLRRESRNYWSTLRDERRAWDVVRAVLESPVPKVGQNYGAYDALWLLDQLGIRTRNYRHDTRTLHHVLHPELPKDLAFLGAAYGTQGPWKTLGRKSGKDVDKTDD